MIVLPQGGASILSAALEAAKAASSQDGHVIAAPPAAGSSSSRRVSIAEQQQRQRREPAAQSEESFGGAGAADDGGASLRRLAAAGTGRLVARAARLGPKPTTESLAGADCLNVTVLRCAQGSTLGGLLVWCRLPNIHFRGAGACSAIDYRMTIQGFCTRSLIGALFSETNSIAIVIVMTKLPQRAAGRLSLSFEEPLSLPRPPSPPPASEAGTAEAEGDGGLTSGAASIAIPSGAASPEPWTPRGVLVSARPKP